MVGRHGSKWLKLQPEWSPSLTTRTKPREQSVSRLRLWTLKACLQLTSSNKTVLPITFPNRATQLSTKYSNTRAFRGHFSFKLPHWGWRNPGNHHYNPFSKHTHLPTKFLLLLHRCYFWEAEIGGSWVQGQPGLKSKSSIF